ncbi:MAG TPA: sulfite exporter TauE/SafE family protein [Candidatus Acidoferrales bacterium]
MTEGAAQGPWRLAAIFATACVVGICSGLFGVGGGVLLVPLLVLLLGFNQHTAQGTSLIALVPPTGLLAFLAYYRAHQVDVKVGLLIIPGVILGGVAGGKLAGRMSPWRMRIVFAILLFSLGAWQVASAWTK